MIFESDSTFPRFLRLPISGSHGLAAASILLLLLQSPPAAAQPSSPNSDDNYYNPRFGSSVGVIIIVLISALFLMGFFSIYIRNCTESSSSASANANGGIIIGRSRRGPRGLEPSVIESFPTFGYASVKTLHLGKGALECAVCLNEFEDDEALRLIPKCDHVFHPECIDEWLSAHTTCPVCRTDLTPQPGDSVHAPQPDLPQISEHGHPHSGDDEGEAQSQSRNGDVVVEVVQQIAPLPAQMGSTVEGEGTRKENYLTERPINAAPPQHAELLVDSSTRRLNRNRTRRNMSGRSRWFGMFTRSNSTGHLAVRQWENMDRFTLRIPEEVRKQIMSGKLSRSTSCVALPREGSSRRGYRAGSYREGGSSCGEAGRRYAEGSSRFDRNAAAGRSDRWVFSFTPPFFSRAPSVRSPRVAADSVRSGGSVKVGGVGVGVSAAGVDPGLPPV